MPMLYLIIMSDGFLMFGKQYYLSVENVIFGRRRKKSVYLKYVRSFSAEPQLSIITAQSN